MPDIESLTSQVQQLQNAHSWWNEASLYLVAVTAVVASLVFIAQWLTNKRGNELREVQSALSRTKEEQLQRELKDKDLQIQRELKDKDLQIEKVRADALTEAKRVETAAQERIAKETARVGGEAARKIEEARAEAVVKIENARAEAAREVGKVQIDLEKQREQTANAQRNVLVLEKALAPRVIPFVRARGRDNLAPLRQFKGMQVMLEYLPDFEPTRAARNIAGALEEAGWKILGAEPSNELADDLWEGVVVELPAGARQGMNDRSREAEDTLIPFLWAYDIDARGGSARPRSLPPNTVRIKVGMKPGLRITLDPVLERLKMEWDKEKHDRAREYRDLFRKLLDEVNNPPLTPEK